MSILNFNFLSILWHFFLSEQTSRRKSLSFHAPSKSPTQRKSVKQSSGSDTHEMSDQEIAEYAGKRAMLRLEQEFSDAAKDRQLARNNSSFHSADSGVSINTYDSIMDHKKLSRIPQVSKSDLIIGEYLGRGNFCDVFEVEWAMKNNRGERLNLSDWYDDDSIDSDEDDAEAVRRKMEYLSLMYSNDIRPEIIGTNINGEIDVDAPIIGSRNLRGSFSQIHTGYLINSSARHLRDPNVMALKCLRPAVRAQPRKFVIGAEDLAHETALLSCLDHPNIIKIYGRAKGSFATAFQFGSSKVRVGNENSGKKKERSMNDGYFIILDKLTATLDGTIDDWAEEYEGLSQRLYISAQLPSNVPPPECNLIEHLAKRLKVAYSIANALEYLHSRHVVFRDLKPANVGFDCNDCVKMFDFGFATSIAPLLNEQIRSGREQKGYGPLTETCGTRRYMAPEVGE
jgi:serine/threonine protein kinase